MAEKTRVLFLAANPRDLISVRLDVEARDIRDRIRAAEFRNAFEFVTRWAVRTSDLLQAFNEVNPHVVHFSGHGNAAALAFEDANGDYRPVGEQALAGLMSSAATHARLVVLNACESERLAQVAAMHVECAVGMSEKVPDAAAIAFAASFYGSLAFGHSVGQAFEQGRTQIMIEGIPAEHMPTLATRSGIDAFGVRLVRAGHESPVLPLMALHILRKTFESDAPMHYVRHDGGFNVGAKGWQLVGDGMVRAAAIEDSLRRLVQAGLIVHIEPNEYRLTPTGISLARQTPYPVNEGFIKVLATLPALVREMKVDLMAEENTLIRECAVLPRAGVMFRSGDKARLVYYESEHANLRGAFDMLEDNGLMREVTIGNTPLFRMTEELVQLVHEFG